MDTEELEVVTGAFSHTGQYIARRLLGMGRRVRTLTGHVAARETVAQNVEAFPFNFDKPHELSESLRGAMTLYNTYWIRFSHGQMTFDKAVDNSKTLIKAAEEAGVQRIVHLSITNPSEKSPFPYFKGKALVEKAIIQSKLSHAIIRPTVIFGAEGILINNIAWLLRKFPIFAISGSGDYQIQPVFVEDVADIAVSLGHSAENRVVDAAGPEIYGFKEFVQLIASRIQSTARMIHLRPPVAHFLARLIGYVVKDVVITGDEIYGLMSNLLVSKETSAAPTRFSDWVVKNASTIGRKYISELQRHYR